MLHERVVWEDEKGVRGIQKAYMNENVSKPPIENGIDVISVERTFLSKSRI